MGWEPLLTMSTSEWGHWSYDSIQFTLTYWNEPHEYEVDLDRCRTSAEVLDWVFQVSHKEWMTPEGIRDFLLALDDLLRPHGTLCPGGQDKAINPREVAKAQGYEVPMLTG